MAVYNYTEGIDRPHVEASQSSNSTIPFPKGEKVPSVEPSIWHRSPKERKYGKPKDKIEKKKMQLTSTTIIIERNTNGSRQNLNSSQELFSFSKIGRPRPFSFILGRLDSNSQPSDYESPPSKKHYETSLALSASIKKIFMSFSHHNSNFNKKSVDIVAWGSNPGRKMVGADGSTVLWLVASINLTIWLLRGLSVLISSWKPFRYTLGPTTTCVRTISQLWLLLPSTRRFSLTAH